MNTIFYGEAASGKSLLAELLAADYKKQGHKVTIVNDDGYTSSRREADVARANGVSILERTLNRPRNHTILTTQAMPCQIYRFNSIYDTVYGELPSLFDYKIFCERR